MASNNGYDIAPTGAIYSIDPGQSFTSADVTPSTIIMLKMPVSDSDPLAPPTIALYCFKELIVVNEKWALFSTTYKDMEPLRLYLGPKGQLVDEYYFTIEAGALFSKTFADAHATYATTYTGGHGEYILSISFNFDPSVLSFGIYDNYGRSNFYLANDSATAFDYINDPTEEGIADFIASNGYRVVGYPFVHQFVNSEGGALL